MYRKGKSKLFKPSLHCVIISWVYTNTTKIVSRVHCRNWFGFLENEHVVQFYRTKVGSYGSMKNWPITYLHVHTCSTCQNYEVKVSWIILLMFNVRIGFILVVPREYWWYLMGQILGNFTIWKMSKMKLNWRFLSFI